MNKTSRTITGVVAVALGLWLIYVAIFKEPWVLVFHGVIVALIGIFIFFNKKEDDIEQIKGRED